MPNKDEPQNVQTNIENQIAYYRNVLGIQSFVVKPSATKLRVLFEKSNSQETIESLRKNVIVLNILKALGVRLEEITLEFLTADEISTETKSGLNQKLNSPILSFHFQQSSEVTLPGKIFSIPHPALLEKFPELKKSAWTILKQIKFAG